MVLKFNDDDDEVEDDWNINNYKKDKKRYMMIF